MIKINNYIAFSLQGVLTPQNSLLEIVKLFPEGNRVYSVLARYEELLSSGSGEDIETGDIVTLIVPFFLLHNIRLENIVAIAAQAPLTDGAEDLISRLEYNSWKTFCLTSSYEQYALHITHKLGIYAHRTASTPLPLSEMYQVAGQPEIDLISGVEKDILPLTPGADDALIRQRLDKFYHEELPLTLLASLFDVIQPVKGRRKLDALNKFANKFDEPLSRWVMIGSSHSDSLILRALDEAKGLSVAYNGDNAAVANSTLALASTGINDLLDVLTAWQKGGRSSAEKIVREKEKLGGKGDRDYYNWLPGKSDISQISETHRRLRQLVQEKSTNLK